jgi:predicted nucleic acid-binding protein
VTRYVVDVCIAVKWYIPEVFSQQAMSLLTPVYSLVSPDYLLLEAGSVFWKKIRRQEINFDYGLQALSSLKNSPVQFVDTQRLLQDAFSLANHIERSIYDCFYLQLAIQEKLPNGDC